MKKKLIIVVFLVELIIPNISFSVENRICQQGIYVIFGNGVWNDIESAKQSSRLLQARLESKIGGTELVGKISYTTAYNPTDGKLADLFETFIQNSQTDTSRFWRILAGLDPIPDFIQNKLIEISKSVDKSILRSNPAVRVHVNLYNKLLGEGNKIILVPHSQGNLFANIAYLGIDNQYISSFGIVSVGNPDSFVSGNGPYTTLDEDIVIGSVRGSLPANLDNFFGINIHDITGHEFVKSYMASGHRAETKILADIVEQIKSLPYPDNQFGSGIITASLTWGSNPDVDLHVYEPNGTHVYYEHMKGPSGYLDHDDVTSYGPEHYFVSCDSIEPGIYKIGVNYYAGNSTETATVVLQTGDQILTRQQVLYSSRGYSGNSSPIIMYELQVSGTPESGYTFTVR